MGEKDVVEKQLEGYNDVFADIINVLLFDGKNVIIEEDLEDCDPNSILKVEGKIHGQERDVSKFWKHGLIHIAMFGVENQTKVDRDMPLRLLSYDGTMYKAQLLKEKEKDNKKKKNRNRYPIVTIVLYFGYKKHWKKPKTLFESIKIPDEIRPYVNDYKINVFEIAYLSDEQVNLFKSDFKIVADYFVQMRKNNDYVPSKDTITHVRDILHFMSAMTKDNRFEEAYNEEIEGGPVNMCEALDKIEQRGIEKGIEKGTEASIRNIMKTMKLNIIQAMDALMIPASEREKYLNRIK